MAGVEFTNDYAKNEADLPRGTLSRLYLDAVDRMRDKVAFRWFQGDRLVPITHDEAFERVRAAAAGMAASGLERGDRAAILSENRPEWALADYACLCSGIQAVPVYNTLTASQVHYILEDSGARLVFASDEEQLEKVLEAREGLEGSIRVVVFDAVASDAEGVETWSRLLERGRAAGGLSGEARFREAAQRADPDDVATILYTSGTTGDPKGVMLTHDNLHSNVVSCTRLLSPGPDDVTLSFLPLAHVFQRMVDYLLLAGGCEIVYPHSIATVAEDLKVVAPTIQVAVPRVYEKVYNKVMEARGLKGVLVHWARDVGRAWGEERLAGREPGGLLALQHRIADVLVYRKIRAAVGGRIRYFVSGGGALSPEINRFFYGAGLVILEGYGLTETSPVTNVNTLEDFRIGSVGLPVPGTEIRIAEDGEILVRGPQVMRGYLNKPEDTAAAFTEDGWFHTGDIGELNDGHLKITDRKKDILVTAGGKNVAPQPIENILKTHRLIDQAVMVGDGRRFLSMLVVPAFDQLAVWAQAQGLGARTPEDLCAEPRVQAMMEKAIYEALAGRARYELPKKIALVDREFTVEDGSLTPSQKVKRKVVEARYRDAIEAFYAPENEGRTMFSAA